MAQVNVAENLFSQAAGNGFTARCLPSIDNEHCILSLLWAAGVPRGGTVAPSAWSNTTKKEIQ